jgi:hypothetical protein
VGQFGSELGGLRVGQFVAGLRGCVCESSELVFRVSVQQDFLWCVGIVWL